MNQNELLSMLNIKPAATPRAAGAVGGKLPANNSNSDSSNALPTALQLDRWDLEQGQRLLATSYEAQRSELPAEAWSDFHSTAFLQEPLLAEACTDKRRLEYVTGLLDTPECQALRASTIANDLAADMAAVQFGNSYAELQKKDEQRHQKSKGKPTDAGKEQMQADAACMRAVGKAIAKATEEVEELEGMQNALGCGPGSGNNSALDAAKLKETFNRVRNNARLRQICELAGRFRRVAQSKQRSKVRHGYDDMVGVEPGGDVGRLLPHELALLADDELGDDAARRLVERQSMCREHRGVESLGRGPIVVCVDESGSMDGAPVEHAKSFALALAWVARHQRRWVVLVGYSGGTEGTRLAMPPGKWDEGMLLEWLMHFFSGGTDMDVPLAQLPGEWWQEFVKQGMPKGKTDLILISDAICRIPTVMKETFLAWKKAEKVRCISLVLNSPPGDLAAVSDEVHLCSSLAADGDAVGRCLSI